MIQKTEGSKAPGNSPAQDAQSTSTEAAVMVPAEVQPVEQIDHLINECQAILTERYFTMKLELLASRWQIGQAVANHPLYARWHKGNADLIKRVAKGLNIHPSQIYDCIQFHSTFPGIDWDNPQSVQEQLPGGKDISWTRVRALLGESADDADPELKRRPSPREKALTYSEDRVGETWRAQDQEAVKKLLRL